MSLTWALKEYVWPRRKMLAIGLIFIVIRSLSGLVLPYETKNLLDVVVPSGDVSALWQLIFMVAGAILIQAATSFILTRLLSVEAQLLIAQLRAQVQRKLLTLPIAFFDNNKSGALVSRVMSDVEGVRNLVGTGLVQLIGGTVTAVVAFAFLIKINAMMTLFVFLPVGLFGFIALKSPPKTPSTTTRGSLLPVMELTPLILTFIAFPGAPEPATVTPEARP